MRWILENRPFSSSSLRREPLGGWTGAPSQPFRGPRGRWSRGMADREIKSEAAAKEQNQAISVSYAARLEFSRTEVSMRWDDERCFAPRCASSMVPLAANARVHRISRGNPGAWNVETSGKPNSRSTPRDFSEEPQPKRPLHVHRPQPQR